MNIVYVGPHSAVWIRDIGIDATRGEPVDVPDELATRLLEQPGNWREPTPTRGTKGEVTNA